MNFKRVALVLSLIMLAWLMLFLFPSPARAQEIEGLPMLCVAQADMRAKLDAWTERPALSGEVPNGTIEFWINPATSGFTVLLLRPDGTACMIASGQNAQPGHTSLPENEGEPL